MITFETMSRSYSRSKILKYIWYFAHLFVTLHVESVTSGHGVILILSNNMEIFLIIDYFALSLQRNNLNNETGKDFSAVYLDCKCVA